MSIKLKGSTDGSVTLQAPADTSPTGTDKTLTLPTTTGSANQFVKNGSTAGSLEYSSMVETSTGVGIGTTSPNSEFHVENSGGNCGARIISGTSGVSYLNLGDTSDNNIGSIEYDNSVNALKIITNNNERCRVDSSGQLLVGTSSDISGSTSRLLQVVGTDAAGIISMARNDQSISSGNTLGKIEVYGNEGNTYHEIADITVAADGNHSASSKPTRMVFSTTAGSATSSTERMRINSSGALLVGRTGDIDSARVGIEGDGTNTVVAIQTATTGTVDAFAFFDASGNDCGEIVVNGSTNTTNYSTSSDYRLKGNVVELAGAIGRLKNLSPKQFSFISDPAQTVVDGFIAHEAQAVVPESVTGTHDEVDDEGNPVYQGIDQSKLVPLLTAALQEAISKIETLEIKVAALEAAE